MTITRNVLIAVAALMAVPVVASAGYSHKPQVSISGSTTHGSLVGARRSSDSLQYIGCYVRDTYTTCVARNASGTTSSCYSYDDGYRQAASAISPSSMVTFQTGSAGVCNFVTVSAMSTYLE